MADRTFEIDIPGVGKKTVSVDLPADATNDEINSTLSHAAFSLFNQHLISNPATPPRPAVNLQPNGGYKSALDSMVLQNPPQELADSWKNRQDMLTKAGLRTGTAAGMLATGAPIWSAALGGALTNSPADAVTNLVGGVAGKAMEGISSANRLKNMLLGAGKGAATFEGLNRLHQFLSGQQQTPLNPMQRSPWENTMQGLAGMLGMTSGYAGAEAPTDPQDIKAEALRSYQQKLAMLQKQADTNNESQAQAAREVQASKFANGAAAKNLTSQEKAMDAQLDSARDEQSRLFQSAQLEFRKQIKAAAGERQDAQAALKQAQGALDTHQADMAAQTRQTGAETAESLRDKLLNYQRILDGLRNPDTAENFLPLSEEEQKLKQTIADQTARLNSGKYNEGAMAQQKDLISKAEQQLEDARDSRVRLAQDQMKDQIRRTQAMMSRANQGRFDEVPDAATLAAGKKAMELSANRDDAAKALDEINQKYRQLQIAQLTHAQNTPGAPLSAVNDIQELEKRRGLAEAARKAFEDATLKHADLKVSQSKIQTAMNDLKSQKPESVSTGDMVKSTIGKLLPKAMYGAAGAAEFGNLTHLNPATMAIIGGIVAAGLKSPAAQKALGQVAEKTGPGLPYLIPTLANKAQGK